MSGSSDFNQKLGEKQTIARIIEFEKRQCLIRITPDLAGDFILVIETWSAGCQTTIGWTLPRPDNYANNVWNYVLRYLMNFAPDEFFVKLFTELSYSKYIKFMTGKDDVVLCGYTPVPMTPKQFKVFNNMYRYLMKLPVEEDQ